MHLTPILLVLGVLGVLGLALVALTACSLVLLRRGSWKDAQRTAGTSFALSLLVLFAASFAVPMCTMAFAGGSTQVSDTGAAPTKARMLAETIAEGMNCTAHVAVNAPLAAVCWGIAAWRIRRAARD